MISPARGAKMVAQSKYQGKQQNGLFSDSAEPKNALYPHFY
jgi:hypothetical protein